MFSLSSACALLICVLGLVSGDYFTGPASSWQDAENYCVANDGHLASVHTAEQNVELANVCMTGTGNRYCWIGLHQPGEEPWQWTDGSSMNYAFNNNDGNSPTNGVYPWHAGEPNSGGEDCIHFWDGRDTWNDIDCGRTDMFALCETNANCDAIAIDRYLDTCSILFPDSQERLGDVEEEMSTFTEQLAEIQATLDEMAWAGAQQVAGASDALIGSATATAAMSGKLASFHFVIGFLVCVNLFMITAVVCLWKRVAAVVAGKQGTSRYATVRMDSDTDTDQN